MSTTPIADYALLSDRHSAALVARNGSVDWLCFPRFDSPSIFARLLGEGAGHWSIRATGTERVTRRYLDRTMVLETTYSTPTGTVVLVDALAMGEGNKGHELGRDAPHVLLRQATCTEGEVEMELEYAPRPEYGLIYPLLEAVEGGLTAIGGADVLVLSSPVSLADGSIVGLGAVTSSPGRGRWLRTTPQQAGRGGHGPCLGPVRDRRAVSRHGVGVGVVVGAAPGLRGPVA